MVSFDDIRNMRINHTTPNQSKDMYLNNSIILLWIFSITYILSVNAEKAPPSIASLLGIYYMIFDIVTYYYRAYIENNRVEEATEGEGSNETPLASYLETYLKQDEGCVEADETCVDNDEVVDEVVDETDDTNESGESGYGYDMLYEVYNNEERPDYRYWQYSTKEQENYERSKKALEQLNEYAEMINQRNIAHRSSKDNDNDYSDMPPLISIARRPSNDDDNDNSDMPPLVSIDQIMRPSSQTKLNPNLRERGHYAASINETDE
jgi:hypothetical protein